MIDIKNVILTNTSVSLWFLSWNPSWSSVNERVLNYRNTQTPSCNRLPITARTSWSKWSTLWKSPADRTGTQSSLFLLLLPFLLCFTECQHTDTNSRTLTRMHKSKDRHIRERLTAHKSSARLDWLGGVGMVGFPSAIPYHHIHPLRTFRILFTLT